MSSDEIKWTRRRLLQTAPAIFAPALMPDLLQALASPAKSTAFSHFTDIAIAAGLSRPTLFGDPSHVTYVIENMGGGCAFFDYDNDGWMDIFVLGGRRLESVPAGSSNRLYHNNRDGTFTDVTEKAGLLSSGWANGVCVGDYNNDGFEDLFVTYYGQNRLYRNNGGGTFTDVTAKAGLLNPATRFGTGCTFIDYNRDSHLDLFVANYVEFDLAHAPKPSLTVPNCNYEGMAVNCMPLAYTPPAHYLYRNNGDGTFTDVSKQSGIAAA
ncbi:MAG TPA: VCBS repeat-containing protein, partial [Acidisarcina sp.]